MSDSQVAIARILLLGLAIITSISFGVECRRELIRVNASLFWKGFLPLVAGFSVFQFFTRIAQFLT